MSDSGIQNALQPSIVGCESIPLDRQNCDRLRQFIHTTPRTWLLAGIILDPRVAHTIRLWYCVKKVCQEINAPKLPYFLDRGPAYTPASYP